nr:hypothetical protein [Tanacetum cinerariifolium]
VHEFLYVILIVLLQMSADVAWGHDGSDSNDDRPPPHQIPIGCRGKETQRPNRGGTKAERFETREYPSLIQTYFDTHTVVGVFLRDEERLLYDEMLRLKDLSPNTQTGVSYTEDEIMTMVEAENKQLRKEINMLMKVVRSDDKFSQLLMQLQSYHEVSSGSRSDEGGDDEPGEDEDASEDEDADGDKDS